MTKGRWIFERSSGYEGYRCHGCGKWIYADDPKICRCDEPSKSESNSLAVTSLTALELLKMVNDKVDLLWALTFNSRPGIGLTWDVIDLTEYHREREEDDISLLATDPDPMVAMLKAMRKEQVKF